MSAQATAGTTAARATARPLATEQKGDGNAILKRLMGYVVVPETRGRFWLAVGLTVIAQLALVSLPFFASQALNTIALPGGTSAELTRWTLFSATAGLIALVFSFLSSRQFAGLATQALNRLQVHLFSHIQTLSLKFFDTNPVGQLISRVNNDSEAVAGFYETAVAQLIRSFIQIGLAVVIIFVLNWRLAIAALITVPLLLFVTSVVQRVAAPAFQKMQEELGNLSGFQEETIAGHKALISNRRQEWAADAHEDMSVIVYDTASHAFFTSLMQNPITTALNVVQVVLVLVVGSLQVLEGTATLGDVIAFTGYASLLSGALSNIANMVDTVQNAQAGGRRVFSILDEKPTLVDAPDAHPLEFKGGHVVFQGVDFGYVPGRMILKDNTFEALPGQKIGLCGPTGAGKSTIMNLLPRYYDINSGRITIDGQDVRTVQQDSLRLQIAQVLQEPFLFTDTVMNNLKYAREGATDEECIQAAKDANAHDFILSLPQGYDTMLTERGANLSGGQRQMITIARAIVADPRLLIMDEATSNVDTRTEKLIQAGLQKLMQGRTSFVIAHRLSTIQDSDKILVLNGGEIVEQGSHDELMAKQGFYYTLYMSQFKGKAPGGATGSAEFHSS